MRTLTQASLTVLASSLSGTLAVAVGALVVVLAIVLVFVMVLRSNGAARKTASGLGYDAQRGPLGQPQPDNAGGSPWQRQGMQQPPAWGQNGDFGGPGGPSAGRANSPAWAQTQDYPGNAAPGAGMAGGGRSGAGQWNAGPSAGQPQGGGWDAAPANDPWPGGGDNNGWNAPQAPASRPAAGGAGMGSMGAMNGAGGGWDMPVAGAGAGAGAGASAGRSPWAGMDNQGSSSPWDQPAASAQDWGAPPAAQSRPPAGAGAGMNAGMNAGGWANDMAAPASAPDWGSPPATSSRQDWGGPAAPQAPQGFEVAGGGFGEMEKTRIARPSSQQSPGMIVVRQGKEPGRIFEVRKERLTIGRSRESDIFLEDLAVSRLHTTVARDDSGRYILRDENSANGTYVNGQRISEHVLDEGDEIQVGQTVLAFVRR